MRNHPELAEVYGENNFSEARRHWFDAGKEAGNDCSCNGEYDPKSINKDKPPMIPDKPVDDGTKTKPDSSD